MIIEINTAVTSLITFFTTKMVLPIFSSFIGAFFAFWFNRIQINKKETKENLSNYLYTFATLEYWLECLYNHKWNVVIPRLKEADELSIVIKKSGNAPVCRDDDIFLDKLSSGVAYEIVSGSLRIENLSFLAVKNISIIKLLMEIDRDIDTQRNFIKKINSIPLPPSIVGMHSFVLNDVVVGIRNNAVMIDRTIYMIEYALNLMTKRGKKEFKGQFNCELKPIEWTKQYKPVPQKEWDDKLSQYA